MKDVHATKGMKLGFADPEPIYTDLRPDKRHALRVEVSYHNWQVIILTDAELVALFYETKSRIESKGIATHADPDAI